MNISKISICKFEEKSNIPDESLILFVRKSSLEYDYIIACEVENGYSTSGSILNTIIHYCFFIKNNEVIDYICPGKDKINNIMNVVKFIDRNNPLFNPVEIFYSKRAQMRK